MSGANQLKGHSGRATNGIEIATRRAKTTFAMKRNIFIGAAVFTAIDSEAIVVISAMKHFLDIFKDGITNCNTAVGKCIEMVIKNLLYYIHK